MLVSTAQAEVKLSPEYRIANHPLGLCGWACLETAANYQKIDCLHGLVNWYSKQGFVGSTYDYVKTQLVKCKVNYSLQENLPKNEVSLKLIKVKTDNEVPVVVSIRHWSGGVRHALLITHVDEEYVYFFDPNNPMNDYRFKYSNFLELWYGDLLTIN